MPKRRNWLEASVLLQKDLLLSTLVKTEGWRETGGLQDEMGRKSLISFGKSILREFQIHFPSLHDPITSKRGSKHMQSAMKK